MTYKNAENVRAAAKAQGLERFMLETDAPYLAPVPFRGKRNESAYIPHIAARLAEATGRSVDEIASITTANANQLFRQ